MAYFCITPKCEKPEHGWETKQALAMHLNRAHGLTKGTSKEGTHYVERHLPATIPSTEVEPKKRRSKRSQDPLEMHEIWHNGHSKIVLLDADENVWIAKKIPD